MAVNFIDIKKNLKKNVNILAEQQMW